jgi:alcohol dehydrogenase, propanol-preferring
MFAMRLERLDGITKTGEPLTPRLVPEPEPPAGHLLLRVSVCGVCHTELDEIEGRTPPPQLPVIPGHQVVGAVLRCGDGCRQFAEGDRVGVAWFFSSCGRCRYCVSGRENLCDDFKATGRDANGGYAELMVAPESAVFRIPDAITDTAAAPLLCAGAIGYRSLMLSGLKDGQCLGLTGFGASAHLVLKLVRQKFPSSHVLVFARSREEQSFARELGATWAGGIGEQPPEAPCCIIDTTPVWTPVLESLRVLAPGGRLVINAIRKEDSDKSALLQTSYEKHIWMEKEIKSVANVTRRDVADFLEAAGTLGIAPEIEVYELRDANRALRDLKARRIRGAKVLRVLPPQ